jgi:hypothetical protein
MVAAFGLVWKGLRCILSRTDEAYSHHSCPGMRAKFSTLLQWFKLIVDNRSHDEDKDLDSVTIDDIRSGIYADDSLHNHDFDPRHIVVLKVCPPHFSERSSLNIMSDAESYPPNQRRCLSFQFLALCSPLHWYPNPSLSSNWQCNVPAPTCS